MKVALIVIWTLAAGVGLFLMVRARIVRATEALTREAARERIPPPDAPPSARARPLATRRAEPENGSPGRRFAAGAWDWRGLSSPVPTAPPGRPHINIWSPGASG